MKLFIDKRSGVHNVETEVDKIDLHSTKEKFYLLDGNAVTLVMLERVDGWQLLIGGGPENFIVTLSDDSTNLTFYNPKGNENNQIEICAGGQYGEYPETLCVSRDQVILVVEHFFENTERKLSWI